MEILLGILGIAFLIATIYYLWLGIVKLVKGIKEAVKHICKKITERINAIKNYKEWLFHRAIVIRHLIVLIILLVEIPWVPLFLAQMSGKSIDITHIFTFYSQLTALDLCALYIAMALTAYLFYWSMINVVLPLIVIGFLKLFGDLPFLLEKSLYYLYPEERVEKNKRAMPLEEIKINVLRWCYLDPEKERWKYAFEQFSAAVMYNRKAKQDARWTLKNEPYRYSVNVELMVEENQELAGKWAWYSIGKFFRIVWSFVLLFIAPFVAGFIGELLLWLLSFVNSIVSTVIIAILLIVVSFIFIVHPIVFFPFSKKVGAKTESLEVDD